MSRAKAHLQGHVCVNMFVLVCDVRCTALSSCVKMSTMKMPTIENRLNAIVAKAHTHTPRFILRSLHCTPIEVPFAIIWFSTHLPTCRAYIDCVRFPLEVLSKYTAEMRWARFRLDFLFYSFSSSSILCMVMLTANWRAGFQLTRASRSKKTHID